MGEPQYFWAKVMSVELLASIVVTAVTVGASYSALSKDTERNNDHIGENSEQIEIMRGSLSEIKRTTSLLQQQQDQILKAQEKFQDELEQARKSREITDRKLDVIIDRLER